MYISRRNRSDTEKTSMAPCARMTRTNEKCLGECLSTGYGLRFSTELQGSKWQKTGCCESTQESCFVTEISGNLRKPLGIYGRMSSRNPVLQFPVSFDTSDVLHSKAPKGNGIGATGSKTPPHIRTLVFLCSVRF